MFTAADAILLSARRRREDTALNLLLLEPADRQGDRFVVHGVKARHVTSVLGKGAGDHLRVGLLEGPLGEGEIVLCEADRVELLCRFEAEAPPRPLLDLILAVPRPKSLAKLLPEVTAFGVDRLVLLRTWRVERPYLSATILDPTHFRPLLHEGLMQARSTREPQVTLEPLFRPFLEDRAPALCAASPVRLVAHPGTGRTIASVAVRPADRVTLVIGPEGGLIPFEIEAFARLGFVAVELLKRPLRVETACVAALAQLDLLRAQATCA